MEREVGRVDAEGGDIGTQLGGHSLLHREGQGRIVFREDVGGGDAMVPGLICAFLLENCLRDVRVASSPEKLLYG